jgi:hypothetical protein
MKGSNNHQPQKQGQVMKLPEDLTFQGSSHNSVHGGAGNTFAINNNDF